MATLAETYASEASVPLGKPEMVDVFYPLDHPLEKTILIHAFAGATINQNGVLHAAFPAKLFDYFNDVVAVLKPLAEAAGFKLVQIGGPGEPAIRGIECLVGKTTMHQCAYLVKGCALLIGNDSIWAHVRGAESKPQVHIYGSTSKPHFPHWRDPAKAVLIESHRRGQKPSYSAQEHPKTINWIRPEQIVNAAAGLLGFEPTTRQSLFFGDAYNQPVVEVVPDMVIQPNVQISTAPILRMDYAPDSEAATNAMVANLQLRKCLLVTNRELNLTLLQQLKPNIVGIRVEVDKLSGQWIKAVKRLGIQIGFFSTECDADKLRDLRLALYEVCQFDQFVPPTRDDLVKAAAIYLNKEVDSSIITDKLRFSTNKLLLSDGKLYLSKAHWLAKQATPSPDQNVGDVIDSPEFWEELHHHAIFNA